MLIKKLLSNNLLKQTAVYTIADGISKALSFIILPFISFYLLPEQLGIVANFEVLRSIVLLIAGLAVVNSLPFFYYDRNKEEVRLLVSNLLFLVCLICVGLLLAVVFLHNVIEHYLNIGFYFQIMTVFCVICELTTALDLIIYRLEEKPFQFAKLSVLQTVLNVFTTVLLVIVMKLEAPGKISSTIITVCIMSFVHLYLLYKRHYLVALVDINQMKMLLKFGIPLLPHSLSFWLKSGMDKILITNFCGLAINGLYSMAMSFGAIYNIFFMAFSSAYTPYLQKRISQITAQNAEEEKIHIVVLSYRLFLLFLVLFVVSIAVSWVAIFYIIDDKYEPSFDFLPWIIFSLTITSFYTLVVDFVYTAKKTFGLGIITFSCSVIHMFITYFMVSHLGESGIKYSLILGATINTVAVWIYSNKVYPLPWFHKDIIRYLFTKEKK